MPPFMTETARGLTARTSIGQVDCAPAAKGIANRHPANTIRCLLAALTAEPGRPRLVARRDRFGADGEADVRLCRLTDGEVARLIGIQGSAITRRSRIADSAFCFAIQTANICWQVEQPPTIPPSPSAAGLYRLCLGHIARTTTLLVS